MKHMLMMVLCCGLPIVLFLLLPAIISVFPAAVALSAVIPLLCPVLMGLMMFMMMRGNGHAGCGHSEVQNVSSNKELGADDLK
jgi:hypothetical protein